MCLYPLAAAGFAEARMNSWIACVLRSLSKSTLEGLQLQDRRSCCISTSRAWRDELLHVLVVRHSRRWGTGRRRRPTALPAGSGGAVQEQPVVARGSVVGLGRIWLDAVGGVALLEVEQAACMHPVISSHDTLSDGTGPLYPEIQAE